jgi:hypothetical protein
MITIEIGETHEGQKTDKINETKGGLFLEKNS